MRLRRLAPLLALAAIGAACGSAGSSPTTQTNAAGAGTTAPAPQKATVMIRHQKVGCHDWSLNGGAWGVNQTARVTPGSTLDVTNADVMPHTLIETSGPSVTITNALMNRTNPQALVKFLQPGTYRFTTKAGEDYVSGITTVGADHVLRLTVIVS
ncbi:MAG: cupredoxin domain-containing protein [Gaiellales bacterium]